MNKPNLQPQDHSERGILNGIDYYKFTMGQYYLEKIPDAQVTFRDTNRSGLLFSDHVEPDILQGRLDAICEKGFSPEEVQYLSTIEANGTQVFSDKYLSYLGRVVLPRPTVSLDERGDIAVTVTGDAPSVSLWETIALSEKNDLYFRGMFKNDEEGYNATIQEGDRRLTEKIRMIQEYNAGLEDGVAPLTFADFGTRRRFSADWQEYVISRIISEAPELLIGTSNVGFAAEHDIKPVGTFAHELMMIFAALDGSNNNDDGLRGSQIKTLEGWASRYPHLRIALSDTFGTDTFFEDFAKADPTMEWVGTRHDSGDPYEYIKKAVQHYGRIGANPKEKLLLFSDGLDFETMIALHRATAGIGLIKNANGIGTNLTNDLGLQVPSQVMKAVEVNGEETCKISDNPSKATGSVRIRNRYFQVFGVDTSRMVAGNC